MILVIVLKSLKYISTLYNKGCMELYGINIVLHGHHSYDTVTP